MKWTGKLNIRNKVFMAKIQVIDKPRFPTEGMCSRIPDSYYHVLFLDYDLIDLDTLIEELEAIQREFSLSDFYIFETRKTDKKYGGYHAICLDCFTLWEANQIVMSSSCDIAFKIAPRFCELRSWVLRTEPKGDRDRPKFITVLKSRYYNNERLQSYAHAQYLIKHYGIPVVLENPDEQFFVKGIKYLTAKRCEK